VPGGKMEQWKNLDAWMTVWILDKEILLQMENHSKSCC